MQQYVEARGLYNRSLLNGDDPTEERKKIFYLIYQFLCLCTPEERFSLREIPNIIVETANAKMLIPIKAAKAFTYLERYVTILYKTPWKREYHRLNTYSGFYQTNITSHLKSAEVIFWLIGYREEANGLFVLTKEIDKEQQATVAFECFVASVECKLIHDVIDKLLTDTVTFVEIVKVRFSNRGNPENIALIINHRHGKIDTPVGQAKPHMQRGSQGDAKQGIADGDSSFRAPFRDRLQEHLKVAQKHSSSGDKDIPYIDDEDSAGNLAEGTLDDHLLASLQLFQKDASKITDEKPPMRASQEWSFVNEELERRKKSGIQEQKLIERGIEFHPKVKRKVATSRAPLDMKISSEANFSEGLSTNAEMPRHVPLSSVVDSISRPVVSKLATSQEVQSSSFPSRHSVNIPPYGKSLGNAGAFSAPIMARSTDTILSNHQNISLYKKKTSAPPAVREKSQTSYSAPIAARSTDLREMLWECRHCTIWNSEGKSICDMCSRSRDSNLETDSPDIGKTSKVCAKCTLDNSTDNIVCDACGSDLMSVHTAV